MVSDSLMGPKNNGNTSNRSTEIVSYQLEDAVTMAEAMAMAKPHLAMAMAKPHLAMATSKPQLAMAMAEAMAMSKPHLAIEMTMEKSHLANGNGNVNVKAALGNGNGNDNFESHT